METDRAFQGSIPALYDQYLGPMIFAPYADDLAARLSDLPHGCVLEVAAGTGVATRALLSVLPDGVSVVATDLNRPMLDHASNRIASGRVTWRQADAQMLPFPDGTFDAVVCQFGAMFFPDKTRAFAEALRVLRPGGRFLLSVWDRIEENEFADVVVRAVAMLYPQNPPMFLARTPHGHHDTAVLEAHLLEAGFGAVRAERIARESVAPSARAVAIGYCEGTPMRGEIEANGADALAAATRVAAEAMTARYGPGPVRGRVSAYVISATQ